MTEPVQLPLAWPSRMARGRDAFFEAAPNRMALATLDAWRRWPSGKCLLTGPEGSGKTHLAHVWAQESGAVILPATTLSAREPVEHPALVVEDAHQLAGDAAGQEALFHWHNATLGGGGALLVTGRGRLPEWGLSLPDLISRLDAAAVARLEAPDDALLSAVLVKLFEDRHIVPSAALVEFLSRRIERSFTAASTVVAELDRRALQSGRPVGLAVARDLLRDAPELG